MTPYRPLLCFLLVVSVLAAPSAFAAGPCNAACEALVRDGHVLSAQGKPGQAYDKYMAAAQAAPQDSQPLALAAGLMYTQSLTAAPESADKWRSGARDLATRAVGLSPEDPVALEVLRGLDDGPSPPLHAPAPEAAQRAGQAEVLFAQRRYAEALTLYEEAMRADPLYSSAWVFAGDCYYLQKDWVRAEAMFRRAGEIEPHNGQAWRFLADALANQGKHMAAQAALETGIGADPSQRPNWSKLAALRAADGLPLKRLALRRGGRVAPAADGKYKVVLDDWVLKTPETPDTAMRLSLALAEANGRTAAAGRAIDAYAVELAAWRTALKVAEELKANTGKAPSDPALLQMQALARDGQLEPAILILLFRQSYRPALASWMAAHPGGVKAFIDRYGLQP